MLPGGTPTDTQFFSESGVLPVSEAFNRFPTKNGIPDARYTAENLLAMTTPLIAGPLQQVAGRQFWSHRGLDELYQAPFDEPQANFWLMQSPIARATATVRMLADDRKGTGQKLFNALVGGARISNVDLQKAVRLHLRDIVERELKGAAGVGEFSRLYPSDLEKMSEESRAELSLLVQLTRDLKKIREEEKAGVR